MARMEAQRINKARLYYFMRRLDILWGEGEVLAQDLQAAQNQDEKEIGMALADLITTIQDASINSGLTSIDIKQL